MALETITIARAELTAAVGRALIDSLNAELSNLYSDPGATHFRLDPGEVADGRGTFLVLYREGTPVGCGALRLLDAETAELKRMYVLPTVRGKGLGRRLVAALEAEARALGVRRLVLETGVRQTAALALYRATGFHAIPLYGEYCLSPETSVCLGKDLPDRDPGVARAGPTTHVAPRPIETARLQLVPATPELVQAALRGDRELGRALGAAVPPTWPPEYMDRDALEFTLVRLEEEPRHAGWWLHFVVLRDGAVGRVLIGTAGYKGPPSADGMVEVGYGIVRDRRRQGFACESVRGLLARAFALPAVRRVIGETLPELAPSIGVLQKCGFRLIGAGSEPGVIRFELTRDAYAARMSHA